MHFRIFVYGLFGNLWITLDKLTHYHVKKTKSNIPPWAFFMFLKLCSWHQIAQIITNKYYVAAKLIGFFLLKRLCKILSLVGKNYSFSYNRAVTATVVFAGINTTKQRNKTVNSSEKTDDLKTGIGKFSTM